MGFYGNITNAATTQFQFDQIYPNRYSMEQSMLKDGIYAGRFVLIEYDDAKDDGDYLRLYADKDRIKFYLDAQGKNQVRFRKKSDIIDPDKGIQGVFLYQIVRIRNLNDYHDTWEFFQCIGAVDDEYPDRVNTTEYGGIAVFQRVSEHSQSAYITNFNIDYAYYGNQAVSWQGYDSTVWQKLYDETGERFVQVAELNSATPGFFMSTYADAPTEVPTPPHFDTASTRQAYYLHAQPQWGFRIAEAKTPEWSDEKTSWNIYEDYLKDKTLKNVSKDGAIYFNRAGFDSTQRSKITAEIDKEFATDKITMLSTGASGQWYNYHDGESNTSGAGPQNDTQELTIHLPSIGNAISDIWDIVYGGGSEIRNRDISWDSTKGLRLIHKLADGYHLEKDDVDTLAGCINSVHDLMGMIIEEEIPNVDIASKSKIYYNVPTEKGENSNKFYIKNLQYYWGDTIEGNDFSKLDRYSPIELTSYGDNYFLQSGRNYYKSVADSLSLQQTYLKLEKEFVGNVEDNKATGYFTTGYDYSPDRYYNKAKNRVSGKEDDYVLAIASRYNTSLAHYTITEIQPATIPEKCYIYVPNKYYVLKDDKGTEDTSDDLFNRATEAEPISGTQYYRAIHIGTTQTPNGTENKWRYDPITVLTFAKDTYYSFDETTKRWTALTSINSVNEEIEYKYITVIEYPAGTPMYEKSVYYYEDEDGNFLLDSSDAQYEDDKNGKRQYFNIKVTADGIIFYEKNKYYYQQSGSSEYTLDTKETFTEGRKYYVKNGIYVKNDINGYFDEWSPWNEEITQIPDGVTLAVRKEKWGWKELEGFADTLTTIHGLFITINRLLQVDNKATRDLTTVQGCINHMNDIIHKIAELIPGRIMIVDEYGRIHGASVSDDEWIQITIDNSYDAPAINISHEYHPVKNTTSTINLNNPLKNTIELYTPQVDDKGHVIGKNTETVTLPYGFKTITTNGVGSNTSNMTTNTNNIVADNTQDTLGLNSDNKWIRIANNASNDTITLAHEIHTVTTTAKDETDLNNVTEFTVQDTTYDVAGHITANQSHTYKLPYNYKTIKVEDESTAVANVAAAAGDVVADSPVDTVVFSAGNKWINLTADADADKITFSHEVNEITTTAKSDTDMETISEFTVQDFIIDEAGHITANQTHKYKLPNSFKTISVYGNSNSTSATSVVADGTADTLTMIPGDTWLELSANASDDKISFYHKTANAATTAIGQAAAASPKFGETFKVLNIGYDDKGHISSSNAYDITLPQVTITNGTGNIVTGLTIDSTTGIITETKDNIANLVLTDYIAPTNVYTTITATDTLKSALSKIETSLYTFNNSFTNIDMKLELLELADTGLSNRILTLEGTINGVTAEDGTYTPGLSNDLLTLSMKHDNLASKVTDIENILNDTMDENAGTTALGLSSRVEMISTDLYGSETTPGLLDEFYSMTEVVDTNTANINLINGAVASGTWIPEFHAGGDITVESTGHYMRVHDEVTISFYLHVTGTIANTGNQIYIDGLPFTPTESTAWVGSGGGFVQGLVPTSNASFTGYVISSDADEWRIFPRTSYTDTNGLIVGDYFQRNGSTVDAYLGGTLMYHIGTPNKEDGSGTNTPIA